MWPTRPHALSIQRIPETPSAGGPLHIDNIWGQIENISGGEVVHGVNTSAVGDVEFRYSNRRRSITDLTFDLYQASDSPESLGDSFIVLRVIDSYELEDETEVSPIIEYQGFIMQVTRTRDRSTDSPRTVTFVPQIIARGGDASRNNVTPEGAEEYLNTFTQIYRTREGGVGPSVDHSQTTRAAHGYSE